MRLQAVRDGWRTHIEQFGEISDSCGRAIAAWIHSLRKSAGDFNSGMPGFAETMSDGEIEDVLAYIKSKWPENIQLTQQKRTRAAEITYE